MGAYIGIDPGTSGGIAAVDESGRVLLVTAMPDSERDILDALAEILAGAVSVRAVLEKVHSSPQMGVVSAFTFGKGYGALRMALVAERVPFDEVTPQRWQKAVGVAPGQGKAFGERSKTEAKNATKRRAQELFPFQRVTHAVADALLLAEYCLRHTASPEPVVSPARQARPKTDLF